jgi:DNA polymerase-1
MGQLEARVFAFMSGDRRLQASFASGDDFYSVIGAEIFQKTDCNLIKDAEGSFSKKYPQLRQIAKIVALAATYGTTAPKMAPVMGKTMEEAQEVIDSYFEHFPDVYNFMLESYEIAKKEGRVVNYFGRPRRLPKAKELTKIYGNVPHYKLPYQARTILNLAVNHRVQSTGASIINRSTIRFLELIQQTGIEDCHLVMNIHDEIVVECLDKDAEDVKLLMQEAMENTVKLSGVALVAEPKIAKRLDELK